MAGMRGFSIFVVTDGGTSIFVLQHRAIEQDVAIPNSDQSLSIISEMQIQFCPWCGVRLHKYYQPRLQELDRSDLHISM